MEQADLIGVRMCRCCTDRAARNGVRKSSLRRPNKPAIKVFDAVIEHFYTAIDEKLLTIKQEDFSKRKGLNSYWYNRVTKEGVAYALNVPEHLVTKVFAELNRLGYMTRKKNLPPHDSKRDFWGGHDSSWCPSTYTVNVEKFIETRDKRQTSQTRLH